MYKRQGDASIDPENIDEQEEGTSINSSQLNVQQGKSNGIDISKWQGKIDWNKVKKSQIDFAYIRIGYRGENGVIYKDDNADYNIQPVSYTHLDVYKRQDLSEYNLEVEKRPEKKEHVALYQMHQEAQKIYSYYLNTKLGLEAKTYLLNRHFTDEMCIRDSIYTNYFRLQRIL